MRVEFNVRIPDGLNECIMEQLAGADATATFEVLDVNRDGDSLSPSLAPDGIRHPRGSVTRGLLAGLALLLA